MLAELFSNALKQAMERNLSVNDLLTTAEKLSTGGEATLASALYRTWLEYNKDNPLAHAMYFNLGVLLSNINDLEGAKAALSAAIARNPDFYPPYINLGLVLDRMGAAGEAVTKWYEVCNRLVSVHGEAITFKTTALKQIGRVLERHYVDGNAEDALRLGLDINQNQNDVIQHWIALRQRQCKWPAVVGWGNVKREVLMGGISSLSLAAHTDDPLLQLGNAYRYCKGIIGRPPTSYIGAYRRPSERAPSGPIKIGYLSSDFREHAIGYLMSEMFGLHDPRKVEIHAYYNSGMNTDGVHKRIKGQFPHWVDISAMTDEVAAQKIFDDRIDILVDINGYTHSARTRLLAMHPAPIIVNWLGYPGTMGSPYHNYIIADDFIIPPGSEIYYSESVKRLPCYQPNDRKRIVAERRPARAEAGLPDGAMVYCCFNGPQKITPFAWRRWMSILQQVPGSVLWVLDSTEDVSKRLREQAASLGVDPARVIFAGKLRNPEHLARYPLADLFLDTTPYGAHTTCSDALWMGVPVLTHPGRSFASRVCSSLVRSAGTPEMVADSVDGYVAMAVDFGLNRGKLTAVRQKLDAARGSSVLFNTPLLVAKLEEIYSEMMREFVAGRLPRPDLSNLDIYNDIGVELDQNDVELLTVPDYDKLYLDKLTALDRYSLLRSDSRLWTEENAAKARTAWANAA